MNGADLVIHFFLLLMLLLLLLQSLMLMSRWSAASHALQQTLDYPPLSLAVFIGAR